MAERVLVTGGGGYIGATLVPRLLQEGYAVRVLDSFRHGQPSLLGCCGSTRLEIIRRDCRDSGALVPALAGVDWIIPLAAIVGAPACDAAPDEAVSVNLEAIRTILELRGEGQRVVFPCTNSGYGSGAGGVPCTEDSPLGPLSLYARTKVQAEAAVLEDGNSLTLRLATLFGASPRMRLDLLVNDFTYRAVHDRGLVLFEGEFRRNFLHVSDAARAFLHGMRHFATMNGRTYNVGLSDANLTKRQLCEVIANEVPGFQYVEAPAGRDPDRRDYLVSNERMEATGYRPQVSLSAGIRELVKAYRMLAPRPFTNGF